MTASRAGLDRGAEQCDCAGPNPLSPYFLIEKDPIFLKKYMSFYIKNKKRGPVCFYMKVFLYFHKFIFKNTSGILKKKHISIRFLKKNNRL